MVITCYGFSLNLMVSLQHEYGAVPVFVLIMAVGLVMLAPFAAPGVTRISFEWPSLFACIALGVLALSETVEALELAGMAVALLGAFLTTRADPETVVPEP